MAKIGTNLKILDHGLRMFPQTTEDLKRLHRRRFSLSRFSSDVLFPQQRESFETVLEANLLASRSWPDSSAVMAGSRCPDETGLTAARIAHEFGVTLAITQHRTAAEVSSEFLHERNGIHSEQRQKLTVATSVSESKGGGPSAAY